MGALLPQEIAVSNLILKLLMAILMNLRRGDFVRAS